MVKVGLSEADPQVAVRPPSSRQHAHRDGRPLPADVLRLLAFIDANLFDPYLNVEVVKRRCGLRDNNVSTRFRYFVGATIREYLEMLRLEAATELLVRSQTTIFDVAVSVGYNNLPTFYAAFRRRYSCTPDAYRRTARDQLSEADASPALPATENHESSSADGGV